MHTALLQGFARLYSEKIECKVENGFLLGGNIAAWLERHYNACVKYTPWLWKLLFEFAERHKYFIIKRASLSIREKLLHAIESFKPDLIISLHPIFTTCALDILESASIKIPFYNNGNLFNDNICHVD